MRIELNLPALERLLGGDTEVELALRKQIVQEFAARHLKSVAETASFVAAIDEVRRLVNESVKEAFGVENLVSNHLWPTVDSRLRSMIESLVKEHAQKATDAALLKIIEYQKRYWGREVEDAVKKAMDRQIEKEIEAGIQARLAAAKNLGKTSSE